MSTTFGVQLDKVKMCYVVKNKQRLDFIKGIYVNQIITTADYYVTRVEDPSTSRPYEYYFRITYKYGGQEKLLAILEFNEASKLRNGTPCVWFYVANESLYNEMWHAVDFVACTMGLDFHNFTKLDIAIDSDIDIYRRFKSLLQNEDFEVILNRKLIEDREIVLPNIVYLQSGSLNEPRKFKSAYVHQWHANKEDGNEPQQATNEAKARKNGSTLAIYDKLAEIRYVSHKDYIRDYYERKIGRELKSLYRTEVRLNYLHLYGFAKLYNVDFNPTSLTPELLEELFIYFADSLIHFRAGRKRIVWRDILSLRKSATPHI